MTDGHGQRGNETIAEREQRGDGHDFNASLIASGREESRKDECDVWMDAVKQRGMFALWASDVGVRGGKRADATLQLPPTSPPTTVISPRPRPPCISNESTSTTSSPSQSSCRFTFTFQIDC